MMVNKNCFLESPSLSLLAAVQHKERLIGHCWNLKLQKLDNEKDPKGFKQKLKQGDNAEIFPTGSDICPDNS